MRVTFLTPASQEVADAIDYYQRQSEGLGGDLDRDLSRTLAFIAQNPHLGSPFEGGTRRMLLRQFPFALIYRQLEDRVVVVAFSHMRRAPGHWRRGVE